MTMKVQRERRFMVLGVEVFCTRCNPCGCARQSATRGVVRARPRRRRRPAHSSPTLRECPWIEKTCNRPRRFGQDRVPSAIRTQTWGLLPSCLECDSNGPSMRPKAKPLAGWLGTALRPIPTATRRRALRAWTPSDGALTLGPKKPRKVPSQRGDTASACSRCVVLCVDPLLHKFGKGAVSFPHGRNMDVRLNGESVGPILAGLRHVDCR